MDFQQQLQQELDRMSQGNGDLKKADYPSNKLKHPDLRFTKDNPSVTVRILPPKSPEEFFVQPAKEIYLVTNNKNNKELKFPAVLGYDAGPDESILVSNLLQWQQQGTVPNTYNKKANPTKKFYVNAVQVAMDAQNNMVMERDQNGELVVRLLKLPQSAYQSIVSKISDPMFVPQNAGEYGLIGEGNAFPIRITKPAPGGMSYTVDVFQRDLGPLPQDWRNQTEDLAYQATPSEAYNLEYVQYFIDVVNGVEGQNGGGGNNQAPQQQQGGFQQQQAPNFNQQQQAPQQNFGQQAPQQQNFNQQQAPQQNFNQQQQAPAQNQGFGQPYNPAPEVPTKSPSFQTQAPQQNFNQQPDQQAFNQAPQQNFNQPPAQQQQQAPTQPFDSGEGQVFNNNFEANLPGDMRDMPNVDQAPQESHPAQTQQAPTAPPDTSSTAFTGVNDVLAQMQALKGNLAK